MLDYEKQGKYISKSTLMNPVPLYSKTTDPYNSVLFYSGKIAFFFLLGILLLCQGGNAFSQQFQEHPFQSNLSASQYFLYNKSRPVEPEPARNYLADDILQYSPIIAVYALNAMGIEGKHRFLERTIYLAGSYVIMGATVYGLKTVIDAPRPDGSDNNSFPSGHSAIAFMGAEFFRKEYSEKSAWYGVAGYTLATTTALLRLHHNRHKPIDVAAGAVIGVLSTQIAYKLVPVVCDKLFPSRNDKSYSLQITPFMDGKKTGMVLQIRL
ncbi:MAG: phosphatase PAP2 family protein [Bacteroidetes bacterium]|nr:MAG: phosphatase PAP2 family protein [Bacteroidota bacterium]